MDTAIARPVVPSAQTQPIRTIGEAAPVRTDLAVEMTVQQSGDTAEARDRDPRRDSAQRQSQASEIAATRRREIESDAATGVYVMKVIEETSGDVVDQVPADAYLRLKVALKNLLAGDSEDSSSGHFAKNI